MACFQAPLPPPAHAPSPLPCAAAPAPAPVAPAARPTLPPFGAGLAPAVSQPPTAQAAARVPFSVRYAAYLRDLAAFRRQASAAAGRPWVAPRAQQQQQPAADSDGRLPDRGARHGPARELAAAIANAAEVKRLLFRHLQGKM